MERRRSTTSVYHVTWSREHGICCLYFWGCNLRCRICLLKKEVLDCHLPETRLRIYDPAHVNAEPEGFLTLEQVCQHLGPLRIKKVFLMGAEPLCDPALPRILDYLKRVKGCAVSLLTNGKHWPPVSRLDEVVFSIKAVTPSLHRDMTGRDNRVILRHFKNLADQPRLKLYAETVFIPGYVDEVEVLKVAAFIASVNKNIPFRIDAYLPVPGEPWNPPAVEELEALRETVRRMLPNTSCLHGRGGKEPLAYEVERIF